MRLTTLVAGTAAGVAGLAGATVGYAQLSSSPRHSETVQVADTSGTAGTAAAAPPTRPAPVTRVRLRDCPRGFQRHGKACVRRVERTVVVHVAPPAAAPARVVAPAEVPPAPEPSQNDDPVIHDAGDDHGGTVVDHHGGRDHGDDDHATEDHGDHGDDDQAEAEDHGDDDQAEVEDHGDDGSQAEVEDHGDEVEGD